MSSIPALQVAGLTKRFGTAAAVVDHVSFDVHRGEIVSILGPSGCGKTTTMRIIAGLEQPDGGDVILHGKSVLNIPPHRRNIGFVFQDLAIFPHKTVRENISFGLKMKGVHGAIAERKVDDALELVELPPATFASRLPSELSGGQRQRVAVARTIVIEPSVILFDEPMAALDRRLRDRMAVELRRIQKQLGVAAVYVTHDQETASMMSDRIAVMGNGRIRQVATPIEIYREPVDRFVADFIGDMNFIPARVAEFNDGQVLLDFGENRTTLAADNPPRAGAAVVALRPEDVFICAERSPEALVPGRLVACNFVSGSFVLQFALSSGLAITVRSARVEGQVGDTFWLCAKAHDIRLFPTQ